MRKLIFFSYISLVLLLFVCSSCEKLLEVSPPIESITTEEIFASNKQAEWAVAGMYTKMINGESSTIPEYRELSHAVFSAGLSTLQGALSADELITNVDGSNPDYYSQINKLTLINSDKTSKIWYSAYRTIFDANAVIDGIAASKSGSLTDSVRKQLTGEALAIRAFCYFYLVNFFGDIPIVLSSDFNNSLAITRSPVSKVYDQIKSDLIIARSSLVSDFSVGGNKRVRVNKWFAEAMLARVYLFTREYQLAINSASAVIDQTTLFGLEQDISRCFLPNSMEAIFQLLPSSAQLNNATPEGDMFNYRGSITSPSRYELSNSLLTAFEMNDKRKAVWTKSVETSTIPAKYSNGSVLQYYTVMRLAEMYLIRAEATLLLAPSSKNGAIDDLNQLRRRADIEELDDQLTAEQVKEAIAHERRIELFAEWGHRWFDLKRTGTAHDVLSVVSYKQPWIGDFQLLYPIPPDEIKVNGHLVQNPVYNER